MLEICEIGEQGVLVATLFMLACLERDLNADLGCD